MDNPSAFEMYRAPLNVHDGPPCILHKPSIVLRATLQLGECPSKSNGGGRSIESFTCRSGKFDARHCQPLLGGRYKYLEGIAEGISAVVITAEDTFRPSREVVVIKVMHQQYRECALQEARLLRFLNAKDPHCACHIVRLRSLFEFQGHVCLVMERLHGSLLDYLGLEAAIRRPKENVLSDLRKIGCQLLTSLAFLRAAGMTHADLKLENVLMSRPCSAQPGKGTLEPGSSQGWGSVGIKLADFGNAFGELDHDEEDFDIQTLSYRAPEVLFGSPPLTPAIDMWSLGCILAELALGRLLFAAQTPGQLLQQMAAALGGFPPRALFSSGRLYDRVFRAAGLAPPGQAKAPRTFGIECGFRSGESEWGSENGKVERGSRQGARTAEEGGSGFHGEERGFGKGFGGSGKGLGGFGRPQVRSKLGTALSLIDPALADLVCWLLEYDPNSRPTPKQARVHPFFKPLNPSQAIAEAFPLAEPVRLSGQDSEERGRLMRLGGREKETRAFMNRSLEREGSIRGVSSVFQNVAANSANGLLDENQYLGNRTALPVGNSHSCRNGVSEDSAKKRKADLMAEVPADVTADVARRDRRTPFPAAAEPCENRQGPGNAPEVLEDGVGFFTPPKDRAGAAHRPAAELKSTPLKKVTGRGSHWSAGEASLPPFCSTAHSFGGQVAASFESGRIGKRSQALPSLSEAGVGPESGNVKKWEEWNLGTGRKGLVGTEQERGPGSLVFVASAEAARSETLEPSKKGSRETVRGRPVAVHTRGDAGERERVYTPGSTKDVSFAEGLVTKQGTEGPRKGANALSSSPEIVEDAGRGLASEPNAVVSKRGVTELGFLKGGVQTTAQLPESAVVETDNFRSGAPPLNGGFLPLGEKEPILKSQPGLGNRETRFGITTPVGATVRNKGPSLGMREVPVRRVGVERAEAGVSVQIEEDIVLRSSGTPLVVESGVTCGAGAVLKAPRAGLVEKLEGGVATAKFARGQENLGAAPSEVGRRVTGGTRVAAEAAVARSREKCGEMSEKLTTGQECASLSDSPDSDSCGSAVISSPPSGEKRLDWAENKGEVVSSCKGVSTRGTRNLDSGGAEPAASELSLTVEPCRGARAKRIEEGDTSPQLCSLRVDCTKVRSEVKGGGSGAQGKKRARGASHEEMESGEPLAGSTKWVRTKSARGSSEGRNATPPLQPQRVLPKRPAREGNSVPWWMAVPPNEHGKIK